MKHTFNLINCIDFDPTGDASKVGMLKGLPNAESRLFLFEADVYKPDSFGLAIEGCEIVFHMATPLLHNNQSSQVFFNFILSTF